MPVQRPGALFPLAVLSARNYAGGKLFDKYAAVHAFLAEAPIGFLVVETASRQLRANIARQAPLGAAQRKQNAMWIERRSFSFSKGLFVSDVIWRLMASSASTTRTFAGSGNLMEPVESESDEAQQRPAAVAKPDRLDDAPGHSGGGMSGW